ncbi:PP2C family protein-serine/threonine phosphatase [Alicyclobacillus dauci]|uniref:Serine/threonine-protein phosphatase n=1 Tax=Alicyclobacillus dauci TaxID=1475485 RepID=A0ABY6Z2G1_9BACL|nr:PP2C family protein-serine/threonine phosphatase [Alicyclobacillus dauci]WAH36793.1 serine/threonine-protein phosphatase [Alicyclobacillus dauci]
MRTNELQHLFEKYLESTESTADEVQAAETIQKILLDDDVPVCDELSCIGMSLPAYRLSGDYYDFIYDEKNGRYWIFIGDVMGKGIPASLLMVMVRSTVRVLTRYSETPSSLVENLNNILLKDMSRLRAFSTLFCGLFDVDSGQFMYTSAGHPSPIFIKKNENVAVRLETKGTVIGLLRDRKYRDFSVTFCPGDLLVLCTDGILEAMDVDKNQYGYERLQHSIEEHRSFDLDELIHRITDDVRRFSQAVRRDDVTIVAVRRMEGSVPVC